MKMNFYTKVILLALLGAFLALVGANTTIACPTNPHVAYYQAKKQEAKAHTRFKKKKIKCPTCKKRNTVDVVLEATGFSTMLALLIVLIENSGQ